MLQAAVARLEDVPEVVSFQTYAGTSAPFNFNGLVRHYYLRAYPNQGDIQVNLTEKGERDRASHAIALELRERLAGLDVPAGTSVKVVEPPPGPPVLATLLAEIYGPDAETRRAVAAKIREAFASVPFIVDVDDSYGAPDRAAPDRHRPGQSRISRRRAGRRLRDDRSPSTAIRPSAIPTAAATASRSRSPSALAKGDRVLDERALATPVPANALPGARGVVELGDVVHVDLEPASYPIFRHNGRTAEMVTGELAGALRGAGLRHDRRRPRHRRRRLGRPAQAGDLAPRPARRRDRADAALGRRVGGHLGHLPRHGRRLHDRASSASTSWSSPSSARSRCRSSS